MGDVVDLKERLDYIKGFKQRKEELLKKEERKRILMEAHKSMEQLRELNEVLKQKGVIK